MTPTEADGLCCDSNILFVSERLPDRGHSRHRGLCSLYDLGSPRAVKLWQQIASPSYDEYVIT